MTNLQASVVRDIGRTFLLPMILGTVVGLTSWGHAEDSSFSGWADKLASNNAEQQKRAVDVAASERARAVAVLRDVIHLPDILENRPRIAAAIRITGILRAPELVDALLDRIAFLEFGVLPSTRPIDPRNLRVEYIALQALIDIGVPAVKPALDRLSREGNENTRNLYSQVVRFVQGPVVAKLLLEKAVDQASGAARDRLTAARKLFGD